MVAEPRPLPVQRGHERAGLLQILQDPFPARAARQHVRQRAAHPLQHRGAQQQQPHLLALPVQHLGQQEFGYGPVGAGKLRGKLLRVRMPAQRQRSQPQPRRPALGPPMQPAQRVGRQFHPGRGEQRPRLGQAEPQIGRTDLGQVPLQPQPVQPQPHIVPGRDGRTAAPAARATARAPAGAASHLSPADAHRRSPATAGLPAGPGLVSSRSTTAQPSRSGAAVSGRTSADPAAVPRSASATEIQNRRGSRSPLSTATHPASRPGPHRGSRTATAPSCRCPRRRDWTPVPLPPAARTARSETRLLLRWEERPGHGGAQGLSSRGTTWRVASSCISPALVCVPRLKGIPWAGR